MGEFYRQKQAELADERRKRSMTPHQIQVEQSVDLLMYHMTNKTFGVPARTKHRGVHICDPMNFDGAEPQIENDPFHADANSLYFTDVKPSDLGGRADVTILRESYPDEDHSDIGDYQLRRVRLATPGSLRGWARRVSPVMAEVLFGFVDCDRDTIDTARAAFALAGPKRWIYAGPNDDKDAPEQIKAQSHIIQVALGMAFSRQYQWRVHLGFEDLPGISFPTDPIGAMEVFRLRDVPNGANRRAALRNWVSEHWRKTRTSPTDETKVRAHLRGATEFTWNGLRCAITPSTDDLRRNEELRIQREAMKA